MKIELSVLADDRAGDIDCWLGPQNTCCYDMQLVRLPPLMSSSGTRNRSGISSLLSWELTSEGRDFGLAGS